MGSRVWPIFSGLTRLAVLIVILAVLAVGAANVPGVVGDKVSDWLSSLNPFDEKTVDRTGPSVLKSLTKITEYHAAKAHYETVVNLQKGGENLPDWVSGERVLYVGKGDVDALVDFAKLDERRVHVSKNRKSVTLRLPSPTVAEPTLDLQHSYVAYRDEGFINKFQGSDLEREAQLSAVAKMTTAARGEKSLIDMAKESTSTMLRLLLGSLGYTNVSITFDE